MSTNHNRIRVADLETNEPNKILKTNEQGELEFTDASNLQVETYNALDCTEEGKVLDARQGKVLKDMMDNEYMKLSENQTFSGVKTTTNTSYPQNAGLVIRNTSTNSSTKNIILSSSSGTGLFCDNSSGTGVFSQTSSGSAGHFYCNGNGKALNIQSLNSSDKTVTILANTNNDNLYITNKAAGANIKSISTGTGLVFAGNNGFGNTSTISKDGNITAKSIELGAGTIQNPALTIPSGSLTSDPKEGAIERDEKGQLWETHNNVRSQILTDKDIIKVLYKYNIVNYNATYGYQTSGLTVPIINFSDVKDKLISGNTYRLNLLSSILVFDVSDGYTENPTDLSVSIYISLNSGWFHNIYDNTYKKEIELIRFYTDDISFSFLKKGINRNLYSVLDLQGWSNYICGGSSITTFIIDKNGNVTENYEDFSTANEDKTDYLTQLDFSFKTVGSANYEDATNSEGKNKCSAATLNLNPLIIEQL